MVGFFFCLYRNYRYICIKLDDMKKIKEKLLTYLFKDWVKTEKDVETLLLTRDMITKRKDELVGHTPVLGFRMYSNNEIK